MAIIGQGVQAGLGRVDYTPYLQGAMAGSQGIAQGIAGIGQGIAQGVQGYLQKKEEKRQEDEASQMITGILKTNPGLSSQLNLAPDEQGNFDKGAIKAAIKGAGGPVNAIRLAMTLEELTNQQKARKEQQSASSYAALLSQGGGNVPAPISNQALAQFSPEARMAGQAAYLQQARQAAELAKTRAETVSLLSPKAKEAPSGFRFTKDGNLEEIPGGPAAVAREREAEQSRLAKASADRKEKELKLRLDQASAKATSEVEKKRIADEALKSAAEDARLSADTTLREIDKARSLIDKPFAQGFGSSIGGFFSGSAANDLETSYDVIRSNEALSRIIALKKASPTGSTGFGALNLKELETLQSRFAKLTRSASDVAAKEALNDLERIIGKAFPDARAQIEAEMKAKAGATRTSAPMSPTQVKAGSRFEIVRTTP
jgi:hypothetical protein